MLGVGGTTLTGARSASHWRAAEESSSMRCGPRLVSCQSRCTRFLASRVRSSVSRAAPRTCDHNS